jgi:GntR family transcriptional regulator
MTEPRQLILDALRGRVIRGIQGGLLRPGDRLPSAPDVAGEFAVDPRLVTAGYRQLELEGLVERRPRGGVYVAAGPATSQGLSPLPEAWITDVLLDGLQRELPAPTLHDWLRQCVETLRLRAVVLSGTPDQLFGLCRELRDDFGLEAAGVLTDELPDDGVHPLTIRRADLLVTTQAHADRARGIGTALGKHVIVVDVRRELLGGEWALLLRRPVYVVVDSEHFGAMLREFYAELAGVENMLVLVHGRDDLAVIPSDAPVYVTQRVRMRLAGALPPGRILPPARTIATGSARELFAYIVHANIEAMLARRR